MKTTILTFGFALVAYAVITIPTIVIPRMYAYSLAIATGFGLAAWLVYSLIFLLVKALNIRLELKWLILIISIPICVAISYTLIEVFDVWKDVWNAGLLMLFPLTAIVSGWISLYKTRTEIDEVLSPSTQEALIY